jgi:hypothetical protein
MALDSAEVVVANSGHGYYAPVGTTMPTAFDETLDTAFIELGYFSEGGCTITIGRETTDVNAWQSRSPVRRTITKEAVSFAFELEQWNEETTALALGGGAWASDGGTGYAYTPATADEGVPAWAFILEFEDAAGIIRWTNPKVELEGDVSITLSRDAAAVLPVGLTVLDTGTSDLYNIYTDMAQFAVSSS